MTTIRAIRLAGATGVHLPLPMRKSSLDAFVAQTRTRIVDADIDLSHLRLAINGAEPVDAPAVKRFTRVGARHLGHPRPLPERTRHIGTLPETSSEKLRRSPCRDRYLDNEYAQAPG